jgi:hypothetical protein
MVVAPGLRAGSAGGACCGATWPQCLRSTQRLQQSSMSSRWVRSGCGLGRLKFRL